MWRGAGWWWSCLMWKHQTARVWHKSVRPRCLNLLRCDHAGLLPVEALSHAEPQIGPPPTHPPQKLSIFWWGSCEVMNIIFHELALKADSLLWVNQDERQMRWILTFTIRPILCTEKTFTQLWNYLLWKALRLHPAVHSQPCANCIEKVCVVMHLVKEPKPRSICLFFEPSYYYSFFFFW